MTRPYRRITLAAAALVLAGSACTCSTTDLAGLSDPPLDVVPQPPGRLTSVRVTQIIDGDTVRVEAPDGRDLGRVRLLGIDAPEVTHGGDPAQCYANEATDLLASLAPAGSTITLVSDAGQPDRDRYGRLLRYVDVEVDEGQVDVSERLLALGAAVLYRSDTALARRREYTVAEEPARRTATGQWIECSR